MPEKRTNGIEYPFVNRKEACELLRCSISTLRRRQKTDLLEGIHWMQRKPGEAILYNQRLLEDYAAHLGDPDAHLEAIEAYKAHLQKNRLSRRRPSGLKRA